MKFGLMIDIRNVKPREFLMLYLNGLADIVKRMFERQLIGYRRKRPAE